MLFTRILFRVSSPLNDSFSPSNCISCLAFFCAFVTYFNTKQGIFTCTAGRWRACSCYKYSLNSSSTLLCFPVVTFIFLVSVVHLQARYCVLYFKETQKCQFQCLNCTCGNGYQCSQNVTPFPTTWTLTCTSVPGMCGANNLWDENFQAERIISWMHLGNNLNKWEFILRFWCENVLNGIKVAAMLGSYASCSGDLFQQGTCSEGIVHFNHMAKFWC